MAFGAKILADSVSELFDVKHRLTTMEVTIPRIVLAEFNTHRVFSRNSASSRAIPIEKKISAVEADPFIPMAFGKNRPGMQASELLTDQDTFKARECWIASMNDAIKRARELAKIGVHKQLANRLIEPFCWQTIIVTATEWDNFFALRINPDAQPEIEYGAKLMFDALKNSTPKHLKHGEWHLPLLQEDEQIIQSDNENQLCLNNFMTLQTAKMVSAGRCARVSYLTHDGKRNIDKDVELATDLLKNGHMSPFEHVARPMTHNDSYNADIINEKHCSGNFTGWVQFRKEIPNENNFGNRK